MLSTALHGVSCAEAIEHLTGLTLLDMECDGVQTRLQLLSNLHSYMEFNRASIAVGTLCAKWGGEGGGGFAVWLEKKSPRMLRNIALSCSMVLSMNWVRHEPSNPSSLRIWTNDWGSHMPTIS